MKLKIWELSLVTALTVAMLFGAVTAKGQQELADKVVRLHVVANSDSDEDQALKLKVRDAVLEDMDTLLESVDDRAEAVALIEANLDKIAKTAGAEIAENGKSYSVTARIAKEEFPTREYDTFSLPAGVYTSLRVTIGEAEGRNWWCVVFPPLCKTSAMEDLSEEAGLTKGEVSFITGEAEGYEVRFKTLEILKAIRAWFK